jgi:hypothetical protein
MVLVVDPRDRRNDTIILAGFAAFDQRAPT